MAKVQINQSALQAELRRNRTVRSGVRDRAEQVVRYARQIAPVDTGQYRDSIHVEKDGDGYRVISTDPKAEIIEFGTRPHIIRAEDASSGGALHWPDASHPVREVRHPGTPGFRVLGRAADAANKRL